MQLPMRLTCVLLIIIWLYSPVLTHAQPPTSKEDILYWSATPRLTFKDFQGKPNKEDTTLRALSPETMTHKMGSIMTTIHVNFESHQGKTTFTIRAGMDRNSSWIKNSGDTISLKHEQAHFDITEIHARQLRKDILKAKSLSEAKDIYDKITKDEEEEQKEFDKENNYQSGGVSKKWKEKIAEKLKELDQYQQPVLKLAIAR